MTKLREVYCRPTPEEWLLIVNQLKTLQLYYWRKFDDNGYCYLYDGNIYYARGVIGDWSQRTEISVEQFLDLIHDRISPWRLEEIGFKSVNIVGHWGYQKWVAEYVINVDDEGIRVSFIGDSDSLPFKNITKLSQLINLISYI